MSNGRKPIVIEQAVRRQIRLAKLMQAVVKILEKLEREKP